MVNTIRSSTGNDVNKHTYTRIKTIWRDIKELLNEGRVFRDFVISIMSIYWWLVGWYLTASNDGKYDIWAILHELSTRREIEIIFAFSIVVAITTNIDHIRSQFIESEQAIVILENRENNLKEGESTLQERLTSLQEIKAYLTQIDTWLLKDINIKWMDIKEFREDAKNVQQKIALHLETLIADFEDSEEKRYVQKIIDINYYQS